MPWSPVTTAACPLDVFTPAEDGDLAGVVIFLPGYDGRTPQGDDSWIAALDASRMACVAPRVAECCWSLVVEDVVASAESPLAWVRHELRAWIAERFGSSVRVAVTGVELGGHGALQLAYRHPTEFPVVCAISPKIDWETWYGHGLRLDDLFPDAEAARQQSAILHVHPLNWPRHQLLLCDPADPYAIDGTRTLASKLASSGIRFQQDTESTHGGFGWNYASAMAGRVVKFLAEGVEDLSRRFV
jgi:S-formylglutathione hydrolase